MKTCGVLHLLAVLATLNVSLHAQWSNDPKVNTPITSSPVGRAYLQTESDGMNGQIIAWWESASGLLVQRIDSSGLIRWGAGGLLISPDYGNFGLVSDGAGGAIFVWTAAGFIKAQRISNSGGILWGAEGKNVCMISSTFVSNDFSVSSNEGGGVLLAWLDGPFARRSLYAQHLDQTGTLLWQSTGVAVADSISSSTFRPGIVGSGDGGAVVTWQMHYGVTGPSDVFAKRVNPMGVVEWAYHGVAITTRVSQKNVFSVIKDGSGGAYVLWSDNHLSSGLTMQHLSVAGVRTMTDTGIVLGGRTYNAEAVRNVDGSLYVAWVSDLGILVAQRLDANGVRQWNDSAIVVSTAPNIGRLDIVSDGTGDLILAWCADSVSGASQPWNIFAQRILSTGQMLWGVNGIPVCNAAGRQELAPRSMTACDDGGAILTWYDGRYIVPPSSLDVNFYCQRVLPSGELPTIRSWLLPTSGTTEALSGFTYSMSGLQAVGGNGVSLTSRDNGASWTSSYITQRHLSAICHYSYPGYMWAVGEGGAIMYSYDRVSWVPQNSTTNQWLNGVTTISLGAIAVGEYGTIVRSTDLGQTWTQRQSNVTVTLQGIDAMMIEHTSRVWACGDAGTILTSTDAGGTWMTQVSGTSDALNAVDFVSETMGFIVGNNGRILKSTNAGQTWVDKPGPTTQNLNGVAFTSPALGWAVGDAGTIIATDDGGETWTIQHSGIIENLRAVGINPSAFNHPATVLAVGLNGTIVLYPNALPPIQPLPVQLASFTARRLSATTIELDWLTLSEVNNYGFYIERRAESAAQWTELPNSFVAGQGTTTEPHQYSFIDQSVLMGTSYYRLKQVDLDGTEHYTDPVSVGTSTSVGDDQLPTSFALQQNYPNPFNPTTEIRYQTSEVSRVTLKVYDVLGREVTTLVDEIEDSGIKSVRFDASSLASGVYYYRLMAGGKSFTRKMLLAR